MVKDEDSEYFEEKIKKAKIGDLIKIDNELSLKVEKPTTEQDWRCDGCYFLSNCEEGYNFPNYCDGNCNDSGQDLLFVEVKSENRY